MVRCQDGSEARTQAECPIPLSFEEKCDGTAGSAYLKPDSAAARCYRVSASVLNWESTDLPTTDKELLIAVLETETGHGNSVYNVLRATYTGNDDTIELRFGENIFALYRELPKEGVIASLSARYVIGDVGNLGLQLGDLVNGPIVVAGTPNERGGTAYEPGARALTLQALETGRLVYVRGHLDGETNIRSGSCIDVEMWCLTTSWRFEYEDKDTGTQQIFGNSFGVPQMSALLGSLMVVGDMTNKEALDYALLNCVADRGETGPDSVWGLGVLDWGCVPSIMENLRTPDTGSLVRGILVLPADSKARVSVVNQLGVKVGISAPVERHGYHPAVSRTSNFYQGYPIFHYGDGIGINFAVENFNLLFAYQEREDFFGGYGTHSFSFGEVQDLALGLNYESDLDWFKLSLLGQLNYSVAKTESHSLVTHLSGSAILGELNLSKAFGNAEISFKGSFSRFNGGVVGIQGKKYQIDKGKTGVGELAVEYSFRF